MDGDDDDGGGTEHVLLPDEGPRIGFGGPEDLEIGLGKKFDGPISSRQ